MPAYVQSNLQVLEIRRELVQGHLLSTQVLARSVGMAMESVITADPKARLRLS